MMIDIIKAAHHGNVVFTIRYITAAISDAINALGDFMLVKIGLNLFIIVLMYV